MSRYRKRTLEVLPPSLPLLFPYVIPGTGVVFAECVEETDGVDLVATAADIAGTCRTWMYRVYCPVPPD
jgi:hypothetical protein